MKESLKAFTRDDIKSGYVVKLRNGTLLFALRAGNFDKILCDGNGTWSQITEWGIKDLTSGVTDGRDIIEVYGLIGYGYFQHAGDIDTEHRPLVWKRKEPVKMTGEEINKKLGYEVEIVASK